MTKMKIIEIDCKRYLWRAILELRRDQNKAHARSAGARPFRTRFEFNEECHPVAGRTERGRYRGTGVIRPNSSASGGVLLQSL